MNNALKYKTSYNFKFLYVSGNDSEWVDIVEPEIRQILELEKKSKSGKPRQLGEKMTGVSNGSLATSTPAHIAQAHHGKGAQSGKNGEQVDLMGDITASPILPHHRLMSGSPTQSPKVPKKFDLTAYKYVKQLVNFITDFLLHFV